MVKKSDLAWTVIGLLAVVLSCYLLYKEIRTISLAELADSLRAIPFSNWLLAAGATLGAYTALAWYDRIAIAHLGKKISWWFITLCSFTTYALAHNIGASVFSGALVRYRAYRSKDLTPQEIGILIVFCSFTFALGTLLAGGVVLVSQPDLIKRVADITPWVSVAIGSLLAGSGNPLRARLLAPVQTLDLGQAACRIPAPGHRRPPVAGWPAGAGVRGGDHLFRPA